ncbi:MAG TPA: BlaI/MecI/CopY family transcriptional regulator [Pirellulales bacterium]|jgi:predicted transcriptional regulator|nr:BlaI/MecI/CopY family transcriptional regulator [Pirellulales bacterium]
MKVRSVDVSETELAILDVLWERDEATIRQINERLYDPPTTATYATVQKLLERLEAKGCVRRDRSGFAHVFRAVVKRSTLIDQRLQEVADKLCGGSLTPLVAHLVGTKRLNARDRAALRKWIEEQG